MFKYEWMDEWMDEWMYVSICIYMAESLQSTLSFFSHAAITMLHIKFDFNSYTSGGVDNKRQGKKNWVIWTMNKNHNSQCFIFIAMNVMFSLIRSEFAHQKPQKNVWYTVSWVYKQFNSSSNIWSTLIGMAWDMFDCSFIIITHTLITPST